MLIKSHGTTGASPVRPVLGELEGGKSIQPRLEPAIVDPELRRLTEANLLLAEQVEQLQAELENSIRQAEQAGRDRALAEFKQKDESRLQALKEAAETALRRFEAQLGDVEPLALAVCRTALGRVFENAQNSADMVARSLTYQLRTLRAESVVRVCVSRTDFPDTEEITLLSERLGEGVEIVSSPQMNAGDCRIDLRLGHVDTSLRTQWDELTRLFEALASGDADGA